MRHCVLSSPLVSKRQKGPYVRTEGYSTNSKAWGGERKSLQFLSGSVCRSKAATMTATATATATVKIAGQIEDDLPTCELRRRFCFSGGGFIVFIIMALTRLSPIYSSSAGNSGLEVESLCSIFPFIIAAIVLVVML